MKEIAELLPGHNCGECGLRSCREFAVALVDVDGLSRCPLLQQDRFKGRAVRIATLLATSNESNKAVLKRDMETDIIGVLDGLRADFMLAPLPGEPSCREDLHSFDISFSPKSGDVFRYRPLGCPITHFAKVLKYQHGIATVHLIGPVHLLRDAPPPEDIGICMVAAFEGVVSRGKMPDVGETVRFLPEHCMMQKVHSGVVVHSEGRRLRIEGIDLKVW
jgi:uncharacterized Fe-S cluster-containing protein